MLGQRISGSGVRVGRRVGRAGARPTAPPGGRRAGPFRSPGPAHPRAATRVGASPGGGGGGRSRPRHPGTRPRGVDSLHGPGPGAAGLHEFAFRCTAFTKGGASHSPWSCKGLARIFIELRFVAVQCIWPGFVARGVCVQRMQRKEDLARLHPAPGTGTGFPRPSAAAAVSRTCKSPAGSTSSAPFWPARPFSRTPAGLRGP